MSTQKILQAQPQRRASLLFNFITVLLLCSVRQCVFRFSFACFQGSLTPPQQKKLVLWLFPTSFYCCTLQASMFCLQNLLFQNFLTSSSTGGGTRTQHVSPPIFHEATSTYPLPYFATTLPRSLGLSSTLSLFFSLTHTLTHTRTHVFSSS